MKKGHLTSPDVDSDPDVIMPVYSDPITDVRDDLYIPLSLRMNSFTILVDTAARY